MTSRHVLITGGSRGIGRATVESFAARGDRVSFCYRQPSDAVDELASRLQQHDQSVFHGRCDVSIDSECQTFFRQAEATLGPVDVLVTSAGIVQDSPIALMSVENWERVVQTNLSGTFHFSRLAAFSMIKRRDVITALVLLSSIAGVYGNRSQANYSASKGGVNSLARTLSKELGPYNVRVNAVAPGFIDTEMTDDFDEASRRKVGESIPLRRIGTAQDVVRLIEFLASDEASYITGQIVQVDGGLVV